MYLILYIYLIPQLKEIQFNKHLLSFYYILGIIPSAGILEMNEAFLYLQNLFPPSEWLPGSSDSKGYAYREGDLDSFPGLGRSPGEGNGNPL